MTSYWNSLGSYGQSATPSFSNPGFTGFNYQQPNLLPNLNNNIYSAANIPQGPMGPFANEATLNFGVSPSTGGGSPGMLGPNGWGGLALGGAQALGSMFMGMKQYGLAKQSLEESKRQFQMNYDAQKNMTNSYMEDRQRTRLAANPNSGQASPEEYMSKWGLK